MIHKEWDISQSGSFFIIILLFSFGVIQCISSASAQTSDQPITILDASAGIDTNLGGIIPLGQIPDERISLMTTVKNNANEVIPGIRIRSFLVRSGREDEISLQLGSDLRTVDLKPGDVKTFTNGYMISKNLKPGRYKLLLYIDGNISSEINSSNAAKFLSTQEIAVGAYVASHGATPVYSPNKITAPGNYFIMRDIDGGDAENIFRITTSGVTIDGGGHTIRGHSNGYTAGIYVDGQANLNEIVIKNCKFEGVDFGIWLYKVSNGKIIDCTIKDCKNIGIRLDQSQLNTISGNKLIGNELGMGIFQSYANTISNNYLKNKFNAAVNEGAKNSWSVQPYQGVNIVGGPSIGGNAWFDLNGSGYSTATPDANNDGIIESPFTINAENIDYYPLSYKPTSTSLQTASTQETLTENLSTEKVESGGTHPNISTENQTEASGYSLPDVSPRDQTPITKDIVDLKVGEISIPETACSPDEILINTTIENTGTLVADHFSLSYFLSENTGAVTLSDTEIGSHQIENLEPNKNLTITDTLTIPPKMKNSQYTIGVIIDPAQDIYEENTINNEKIADHQIQIAGCANQ